MRQLAIAVLVAAFVSSTRSSAAQNAPAGQPPRPQTPTFRAGVEVTTLDVTVVDNNGQPVTGLTPADFTVRVDGRNRRVVRAEWIALARPVGSTPRPAPPENYSTNEGSTGGRLILIAIDQPNIRVDGAVGIRSTVEAFLDRLEPEDRVAAVALGGGPSTPFTTNRATVKEAINGMSGEMRLLSDVGTYSLSATEAVEISDGNSGTLQMVVTRECVRPNAAPERGCPQQVASDAHAIATLLKQEADRSMAGLRGLFDSLRKIEAPKTLVLISEGFVINAPGAVAFLSELAAEAKTSVFALKLDDRVFDTGVKRRPPPGLGDRQLRYAGLDILTSQSRGAVFDVIGKGGPAFERLEREISGYYLLGIESEASDSDGRSRSLNVRTSRPGTVRARRNATDVAIASGGGAATPMEAVSNALGSPLLATALPLHVATFSMRGQDPARIQLLIHVDIGNGYTNPTEVTLGYVIVDAKGTNVVHQVGGGRLAPPSAAPAPLGYTVSASLLPGEYTLKFAVTEGSRTGSVEHPVHAGLIDAGSVKLSELMIGGPIDAKELARPEIGHDIAFGGVQGYVEAYGGPLNLLMRYEIAPGPDAPSLLSSVVPGRAGGDGRTVFSYLMPVKELTPGPYFLRATLSEGGAPGNPPLKKLTRAFRVLPTVEVSATTAATTSAPPAAAPYTAIARPFSKDDALKSDVLQRFRATVPDTARTEFEAGVTALTVNDFVKAEQSFKNAQRQSLISGNSTGPLTYLAATYAASNHDLEAANVWRTALIDGQEHTEIYEWLSESLIRTRRFDDARGVLQEAAGKWPAEKRFADRLAELPAPAGGVR